MGMIISTMLRVNARFAVEKLLQTATITYTNLLINNYIFTSHDVCRCTDLTENAHQVAKLGRTSREGNLTVDSLKSAASQSATARMRGRPVSSGWVISQSSRDGPGG